MTTKSGRVAFVEYNGTKIAGLGTWTLGGFTREVIEEDSWDLDIKEKHFSVGDAGTITFSGLHDPASAEQILIDQACLNSSLLGKELEFWIDGLSYWRVATGGYILITKCQSITMEKSAMGTVDFEAVVSGGEMILAPVP